MIVIFCLRTKNSCRISKSTTLPQVTSDIITFSRMVRFSCVLPLWKAIELTIMPVLTVLKNIENWPFYSQSRKTWHFFWPPFRYFLFLWTLEKCLHYTSFTRHIKDYRPWFSIKQIFLYPIPSSISMSKFQLNQKPLF